MQISSPVRTSDGSEIALGSFPAMSEADALKAVDAAYDAWNGGGGDWPLYRPDQRIAAVERWVEGFKKTAYDATIETLQWEICKNNADAKKEIDRTLEYIANTCEELRKLENSESTFNTRSGVIAQVRRAPYGVAVLAAPFNYPFNELHVTLFPALLMGNCVVVKLPRVGALLHQHSMELFKSCFPPGVVNIIWGSGRATLPPVIRSGKVDIMGFIGSSNAATNILKEHPAPHRLRLVLGLDAKNPAIVCPDADLSVAVNQCLAGTLGFNGQRCTALKLIYVHADVYDAFVEQFSAAVDSLSIGQPFSDAKITPLAEGSSKVKQLRKYVDDALAKGARVTTKRSSVTSDGEDAPVMAPVVVADITRDMVLFEEEQFGPVVPIMKFTDSAEVLEDVRKSNYGQQASVFSTSHEVVGPMVDRLANMVCRINLNAQCQRGPDHLPFTGRRDSALGTLSIFDAIRAFSIRTCVATTAFNKDNEKLVNDILSQRSSSFLRLDYLFP